LSFNNIADADTAIECVRQFPEPACVIVKHANPCGVAVHHNLHEAYDRAYRSDPTSAYGGIIGFNRPLDVRTAEAIIDRQFAEVIAAPEVDRTARERLAAKPNIRVLATGNLGASTGDGYEIRTVNGGALVQDRDEGNISSGQLRLVSARSPDAR
jgi:phosphoribosylaminoimidazolecarboxamide formyltransferase/IMP cyclohydrolase